MPTEREVYDVGDVIEGNLRLIEKIGEGRMGTVFLAEDADKTYFKYAVKRLDKSQMDQTDETDYKREIFIMKQLSGHLNIVQYIKNFETDSHYYLVMEYCETDLFELLAEGICFPTSLVKKVFNGVVQGLNHAHKNGIYHRDIKVIIQAFIASQKISDGIVKIADFGQAIMDKYSNDFGVGSSRYMAPKCFDSTEETGDSGVVIKKDCYNTVAADVWSVGILLVNLIFGICPWYKASKSDVIFEQYISTDPYVLMKKLHISEQLDNFLKEKVFNIHPEKRCDLLEFNAFVAVPSD